MITVVVSSYNYGHLAAHCVESIIAQTKKPEKIIFVDDAANDCDHIKQLYPDITFHKNSKNYGTVLNFQNILYRIETEYCMFIGADNWLRSDAIEAFLKIIDLEFPDIITYDMILTGELKNNRYLAQSNEMMRYRGDYYWTRNNKHHGSMLYRTSLAKQVGGYEKYDDSQYSMEDLSLWDKMVKANAKIAYINDAFLYYRHHRENYNKYHI
jgi:glycosyltransferase involved in cell wall biosynthesis